MILAVPIFLVGRLRPITLNVLIQYTSTEFGWKLSKAVILVSEVAAFNLVTLPGSRTSNYEVVTSEVPIVPSDNPQDNPYMYLREDFRQRQHDTERNRDDRFT